MFTKSFDRHRTIWMMFIDVEISLSLSRSICKHTWIVSEKKTWQRFNTICRQKSNSSEYIRWLIESIREYQWDFLLLELIQQTNQVVALERKSTALVSFLLRHFIQWSTSDEKLFPRRTTAVKDSAFLGWTMRWISLSFVFSSGENHSSAGKKRERERVTALEYIFE